MSIVKRLLSGPSNVDCLAAADLIEQQAERIKELEAERNVERDNCVAIIATYQEELAAIRQRIADAPVVAHAVMNGDQVIQLSVSCDPMFPHSSQLISKEDLL